MTQKDDYKTDTLLSHLGRDPKSHHGAVNPPVYHASTILFEDIATMRAVHSRRFNKGEMFYGRLGTPTTFALEDAIAELEHGYGAIAVPSGLAAIAGALLAFVKAGDHILVTDSVYGRTRDFCDEMLSGLGVETTYYDPLIGGGIEVLIRPNTKVVFTESPGSLTFEVQDIPAIADAAHRAGAVVMMDNTWATPVYYKPLDHGVDVSILAGTKYIVGHSDAMLGLITTNEVYFDKIRPTLQLLGYGVGPDDIYLALRGLRSLSLRLERHQENGLKLARWLQNRPEVARVLHPALPDDPGHELWRRDFTGASGLFGFVLHPCSDDAVVALVDNLALFGKGVSWGGYESLMILVNPAGTRSATPWQDPGPVLRVHAGIEDTDDLVADLEYGFEQFNRVVQG